LLKKIEKEKEMKIYSRTSVELLEGQTYLQRLSWPGGAGQLIIDGAFNGEINATFTLATGKDNHSFIMQQDINAPGFYNFLALDGTISITSSTILANSSFSGDIVILQA
jgi:hypothetical protein